MTRILRALRGQERLAVVFWGYCIVGTLLVGVVMFWAFRLFSILHRTFGNLATGVLFVAYFLWAYVSLWRCAFNAKQRAWGYAARCYAVVVVIYYFVGVADTFGPVPSEIEMRRVF
jgi:hypothetical protein